MKNLNFAIRHLLKNKVYSFIILASLSLGFCCTNLLIAFLVAEMRTDSFHKNHERIFQAFTTNPFGEGWIEYTTYDFPSYLTSTFPEAQAVCQITDILSVYENPTTKDELGMLVILTDSSFFTVFDFELSGRRRFPPNEVWIKEEKAKSIFGDVNPIGQPIKLKAIDTTYLLVVAGVIGELPGKSHLQFDAIAHRDLLKENSTGGSTYVLLANKESCISLSTNINKDPLRPSLIGPGKANFKFEPLVDSYFNLLNKTLHHRIGNKSLLLIGLLASGLILLIATINFANLLLLSFKKRTAETAVRRIHGARFPDIIKTNFVEIVIYVLLSFNASMVLTFVLRQSFNEIFQTSINNRQITDVAVLALLVVLVILISVVISILVSTQQLRVSPVSLFRSKHLPGFSHQKVLFIFQFVASIVLIFCAVTVVRQLNLIQSAPLGFNKNVLQLKFTNDIPHGTINEAKRMISMIEGVHYVSRSSGNPMTGYSVARFELPNNEIFAPLVFKGDEDFTKALQLSIESGAYPTTPEGVLVNETLIKKFQINNDPIGRDIPGTKNIITGVVNDFVCTSLKTVIPPVMISPSLKGRNVLIDYSGAPVEDILVSVRKIWSQLLPDRSINYSFIQDELNYAHKDDRSFLKLMVSFAIVAMLISCFGLFAFSWSLTENKRKEIAIRKTLGASTANIAMLLTRTFLGQIVIALVVALPIGWYIMELWLSSFVSKAPVDIITYGLVVVVIIMSSATTLLFQTLRASVAQPVDEIRASGL
jgi:putative ABC transport system permease protein